METEHAVPSRTPCQTGIPSKRTAGALLVVGSLLEILAMAHHPAVKAPDFALALKEMDRLSHPAAVVHGVLIGLMLLIAYGFSEFALRRSLRLPLIRAGAIVYSAGVVVMIGAALVSGWMVAELMSSTPHETEIDREINAQLLALCGVVNQICARFGVVAMCAGIGFWSIDLLRGSAVQRMVGMLGCCICTALVGILFGGFLHLDVAGMSNVVTLQAVWGIAVGVMLIRDWV